MAQIQAIGSPVSQLLAGAGISLSPAGGVGVQTVSGTGMALIADQLLVAPAASISFTNIPQTFKHLMLYMSGRSDRAAVPLAQISGTFNGDGAAHYTFNGFNAGAVAGGTAFEAGLLTAATATASWADSNKLWIFDYASTTFFKTFLGEEMSVDGTNNTGGSTRGNWQSTAAITSIGLTFAGASNAIAGSRFTLYGLL